MRPCYQKGSPEALAQEIRYLEDVILDWHKEDRDSEDQDRASTRLWELAEEIRKRRGLDR